MTNTKDYSNRNASAVLAQVQAHIAELAEANKAGYSSMDYNRMAWKGYCTGEKRFKIGAVCDELSIFDWWNDYLSMSQLKQMEKFLKQAIKLGFEGYVCFKVGAAGCSHGMWAHKKETTTGYSPDGDVLFHSFRSGDNYFDMELDGKWMRDILPGRDENEYKFTMAEVKQAMEIVAQAHAQAEVEKRTLEDVLKLVSAVDDINIQEPAEKDTTGQVYSGKCSDFRATFPDAHKYLKCEVGQIRAFDGVIIILLNEQGR